jgi:hypothetical protein
MDGPWAANLNSNVGVGAIDDPVERDADRMADQVVRNTSADHSNSGPTDRGVPETGQGLDPATRRFMEAGFGHDFSRVRVYADSQASESARSLDARAYTAGQNIFFDSPYYAPQTHQGRHLLAHELAHVVQERGSGDTGVIRRQEKPAATAAPAPSPAPAPVPSPQPAAADQGKSAKPKEEPKEKPAEPQKDAAKDLKTRVREWLDQEEFGPPLILDSYPKPPEQWRAFYSNQLWTLSKITDDTFEVLHQVTPDIKRGDVWQHVYQYYQEKEKGLDASSWQLVIQTVYTPSYTLWSSPPVSGSPWQRPIQTTLGATYAAHRPGEGGLEHQFAVTGSFFNLGSGHLDWFQNALFQYQLSSVFPVGHEFKLGGEWATAQASIYAQLAAGLAATWDENAAGQRKAYLGLLLQPGAGGQFTVNIGWLQIFVQNTVVFSYFSKTKEEGSKPISAFGIQPGIGIGGQF